MAETEMRRFTTELQDLDFKGRPKKSERVISGDLMGLALQVVLEGGETNRHAHTGQDAAWLVLEGRARFYGKTDEEVFELNVHEGVFIPDGQDYWFESASGAPLKILRFSASDPRVKSERLNMEPLRTWQNHPGSRVVTGS